MLNFTYLPTATRELLLQMKDQKWIEPFTLVGGSVLAIQMAHRQSEDLDFILDDEYLDVNNIKRSVNKFFSGSFRIIRIEDSYQIDFIIRQVNVIFSALAQYKFLFKLNLLPKRKSS